VEAAIVNTTVAGHCAAALGRAGVRVVSLVHELPTLIRSYGLELEAEAIVRHAHKIVFPAPQVRDGFAQFVALDPTRAIIRPQGLFVRSRHVGKTEHTVARAALRRRLQLPTEARIVLAVGYGDSRKGVDLFCEAASRVRQVDAGVHFVWVGHYDADLVDQARRALKAEETEKGVHFIGKEFATDDFYAGADIYALSSREDPFPSVLLESLSVGTPVVAFAGAGGADSLLPRCGGYLVAEFTARAFADELLRVLADTDGRRAVGERGADLVAREYSFRQYVFHLLDLCGIRVPRVTVVVPNYNYGSLLPDRLGSIFAQTLPPRATIASRCWSGCARNRVRTSGSCATSAIPGPFSINGERRPNSHMATSSGSRKPMTSLLRSSWTA